MSVTISIPRFGLLTHCYDSFSKANFASLTRRIAEAAVAGDGLCAWLFEEAGRQLGRHIRALAPAISPELTTAPGGAEDQVQVVQTIVASKMLAQIESGNFPHGHFQLLEVWHRPKSPNLKKGNWIYL